MFTCEDPDVSVRGSFLLVINIFHRGLYGLPRDAIGCHCFSRVIIPEFLRKPIATCDLPSGSRYPGLPLWIRPWFLRNETCIWSISHDHRCLYDTSSRKSLCDGLPLWIPVAFSLLMPSQPVANYCNAWFCCAPNDPQQPGEMAK